MILNDEMTNEQKTKEMVNNGSICQITKVKKVVGYYNQYDDCNNTIIKPGVKIVTMQDNRSTYWDIINQNYDNNWDTIIECFARPIAIYDYEDEFESYTETKYKQNKRRHLMETRGIKWGIPKHSIISSNKNG